MKRRTRQGALLTELLVAIAQARPAIERIGHRLGEPSSLTFSAWQVASALGEGEATVPELAERLGRRRQTVQVAVDELVRGGHATKVANPRHARSPRIRLTPRGTAAFWETAARQVDWVNATATAFEREDLDIAVRVLHTLTQLLADAVGGVPQGPGERGVR
jgi:DNA-binding MarR family transcriptional regulator